VFIPIAIAVLVRAERMGLERVARKDIGGLRLAAPVRSGGRRCFQSLFLALVKR